MSDDRPSVYVPLCPYMFLRFKPPHTSRISSNSGFYVITCFQRFNFTGAYSPMGLSFYFVYSLLLTCCSGKFSIFRAEPQPVFPSAGRCAFIHLLDHDSTPNFHQNWAGRHKFELIYFPSWSRLLLFPLMG